MTLSELVAVEVMGEELITEWVVSDNGGTTYLGVRCDERAAWDLIHYMEGNARCELDKYKPVRRTYTRSKYDTNIADAWRVVEKMRADGWLIEIEANIEPSVVVKMTWRFGDPVYSDASGINSAPLAICLAALRACGVSEDRIEQARRKQ